MYHVQACLASCHGWRRKICRRRNESQGVLARKSIQGIFMLPNREILFPSFSVLANWLARLTTGIQCLVWRKEKQQRRSPGVSLRETVFFIPLHSFEGRFYRSVSPFWQGLIRLERPPGIFSRAKVWLPMQPLELRRCRQGLGGVQKYGYKSTTNSPRGQRQRPCRLNVDPRTALPAETTAREAVNMS